MKKEKDGLTPYQRWFNANREKLNARRRRRYREDKQYREGAKAQSRRYRKTIKKPKNGVPPEYLYTLATAADAVGISLSQIREWLRKDYFPTPAKFGGCYWFTETQVGWLTRLREFFDLHGPRRGPKVEDFALLKDLVRVNW